MLIINIEIMKIIDGRQNSKNKNKNKQRKEEGGQKLKCWERVRAKWFCCAFKLGFLQLICKASLTFKSKLELALSIILKERVIQVKACCGGVYLDV